MILELSDTLFLLIVDLTLLLAALSLAALTAEWLDRNPESRITRWLDRQFRRAGF